MVSKSFFMDDEQKAFLKQSGKDSSPQYNDTIIKAGNIFLSDNSFESRNIKFDKYGVFAEVRQRAEEVFESQREYTYLFIPYASIEYIEIKSLV